MEPWMYDEEGNLQEGQVRFDYKQFEFRADHLGDNDADLSEGTTTAARSLPGACVAC